MPTYPPPPPSPHPPLPTTAHHPLSTTPQGEHKLHANEDRHFHAVDFGREVRAYLLCGCRDTAMAADILRWLLWLLAYLLWLGRLRPRALAL